MSNAYPTITIDLILDRSTVKDVLHGVLHSILFHRLFGTIKPTSFEVLDVTMIEQLVSTKVDSFWRNVDSGIRRGKVVVTFSPRRSRRSWFSAAEELVPWEQCGRAAVPLITNATGISPFPVDIAVS
ncbi:hypothetical protein BKA70DRAFT_1375276 [Coprinopsis sp. MPI-PUGE-AT-0042]|nr:hypothetical protein BKA70DRAFT_1375276 [Coprinopsis sp. MPI-PUGE-AT-0042]